MALKYYSLNISPFGLLTFFQYLTKRSRVPGTLTAGTVQYLSMKEKVNDF